MKNDIERPLIEIIGDIKNKYLLQIFLKNMLADTDISNEEKWQLIIAAGEIMKQL